MRAIVAALSLLCALGDAEAAVAVADVDLVATTVRAALDGVAP